MTRAELLEVIANGENSGVEFKSAEVGNRELARELVALANLQGGQVLVGVDDDGAVSGIDLSPQDLEQWVMQTCRDKIRPELNPYFEIVTDVAPGRSVAVVRVDRGWNVHHLWHNNHRTYYVRVGSTNREASPEELERMFQQRQRLRAELQPVSGTSIEELDRRRLVDYFEHVRGQPAPPVPLADFSAQEEAERREADWRYLLANTEFLGGEGTLRGATVAGLILFGTNPSRFLPQAKIDAAAYYGSDKDYDAKERCTLRGPLTPLGAADGTLLEPGLVEQAMAFIRRNIETTQLEDGLRRRERWDYPAEALRETIVNAVVHRDYLLSGTDIELSIYADRLEVISPGRLPNGVTPDSMRLGIRSARNELLKDVMRDYGYLEHMGMGVPRKIVRGMREHNGTEPELIEQEERFMVRLWKASPDGLRTSGASAGGSGR